MPPKNAALYIVVTTCETPPPSSSRNTPPLMTVPVVKPLASVRSPTVSLKLKVSPGLTIDAVDAARRRDPG